MAGTCFVGRVLYSADGWQFVPMLCAVVVRRRSAVFSRSRQIVSMTLSFAAVVSRGWQLFV